MLTFEWNQTKAASNLRKHGVTFDVAKSIFVDPFGLCTGDLDHIGDEDRHLMLGMSERSRLLTVCFCEPPEDSVLRIISARKATRRETKTYEECLP